VLLDALRSESHQSRGHCGHVAHGASDVLGYCRIDLHASLYPRMAADARCGLRFARQASGNMYGLEHNPTISGEAYLLARYVPSPEV
jgi:hypothetical protein